MAYVEKDWGYEGKATEYVKFDGNLVFIDPIGDGQLISRFIDSGEYADINKVYYYQAHRPDNLSQESDWRTVPDIYLLVAPDTQDINLVIKQFNRRTIYKAQTASSAD